MNGREHRLRQNDWLSSELRPLSAKIQNTQEGNYFSMLWRSDEIESQLNEVKETITTAVDDLRVRNICIISPMRMTLDTMASQQTRQSIILHATVEHFEMLVITLMQVRSDRDSMLVETSKHLTFLQKVMNDKDDQGDDLMRRVMGMM